MEKNKLNILISGCTCSGKSTLASEINDTLNGKCTTVCQDIYFKNKEDMPRSKYGLYMDSPNAFHCEEFIQDMNDLVNNGKVIIPSYSILHNRRENKNTIITSSDINIFEGLHTIILLKDLRDTLKIFINTDIEECLKRRIERDKKYNSSSEDVRVYFYQCIFPMYKVYIENQKELSDIVIESESDKECLLRKLMHY